MAGRPSSEAIASGQVLAAQGRREAILREIAERGIVQIGPMASALGVSAMTLRRDLEELEREGRLARIRGGAVRPPAWEPVVVDVEEPEFQRRMGQALGAKEAIAAQAAGLLDEVRTLALDVGTTTLCLARRLSDLRQAKIFTNNLRIAQALADAAPEVYLAGGRVRPVEQAVGGPAAVAQFGALWFDAAMIGVSGITADGFYDYSFEDADLKRIYFTRATRRIVLADSGKFNRRSLVAVGRLDEATDLVTDAPPPEPLARALAEAGVRLHLAGAPA
ncbi:MAG: DeoR/GlpR family DNA-binding transcription regulator [Rhodobacteraceae bacterium]|nr:DeoR/GlpR family DNA-binding transcription regulator [Paracoccaceae bacterium]